MNKKITLLLLCIFCFSRSNYSQIVWEKMDYTIPNFGINSIAINSNDEVFLGSQSGIYRSTDKGVTCTLVGDSSGITSVSAIAISQSSNTIIIVNGDNLARSVNNGESWTLYKNNKFRNAELTCSENGIFYAGTVLDGVFRSTDDGVTWESVNEGLTQNCITSFTFGENNEVYCSDCSTEGNDVYYSSDSGDHWNPIPINGNQFNVSTLGYYNGIVYALAFSEIYRSEDKGITWEAVKITSNNHGAHTIKIDEHGNIYAVTLINGIYCSTNNGNIWNEMNTDLSEIDILASAISPEGYIYLGTQSGSLFRSINVTTSVQTIESTISSKIKLEQNYPNPFNPSTTLSYSVSQASFVKLKVYDCLGNEIETLVNDTKQSGIYQINFNGKRLSSGVYYYKLQVGNTSLVKKMLLLK